MDLVVCYDQNSSSRPRPRSSLIFLVRTPLIFEKRKKNVFLYTILILEILEKIALLFLQF